MSTDTAVLLPTPTEAPVSDSIDGPDFPTRPSLPPNGNDKAPGPRAEDYIDILVRARNWLARGE